MSQIEIKSAEDICHKYIGFFQPRKGYNAPQNIINAMKEYAKQFQYDYSQSCKRESTTGQTWCCNQCGLPTNKPLQNCNETIKH